MPITITDAVCIAQELEPHFAALGYHIALTGSTLFKGQSEKDVDFVFYPHDPQFTKPIETISMGISPFMDFPCYIKYSDEHRNREVIKALFRGTKVDFLKP